MRNSGLIASLVALSLIGSTCYAQEGAIKADDAASINSRNEARLGIDEDSSTPSNESSVPPSQPQPVPMPANIFLQDTPVVVAEWDGGRFTNQELSATLAVKRPASLRTVSPDQFARLTRQQQIDAIKLVVQDEIHLQKARETGINEQHPDVANAIENQENALLNRLYYESQITPAIEAKMQESARKYYDENRETRFTRPGVNTYKVLHVSTYELITAEEGDTLENLARQIAGDAAKASSIREAQPPYFEREVPKELTDKVLSTPLKGGEALYVPMGEDAISSATKLAELLRSELLTGKDVKEVAASRTDEDFDISATDAIQINKQAGYWDEILDAAESLSTTVSEVIRTPAGLNVVVVDNKVTTSVYEFDEIKDVLLSEMTASEEMLRQIVEETRKEILERLWEKYNVTINEEVIGRSSTIAPDVLSTSTAIATINGDFTYTLEQYTSDLRMTGKDWGQLTREERMEVLKVAPAITNHLTAMEARDIGLADSPDFQRNLKYITEASIVSAYRKLQAENKRVTDDDLRAFYNDNLDKYTSPSQVRIREISKRINMTLPPETKAAEIEKARQSLNEIRSRITNEEDFAQLARRESEAISTRSRGGLIGIVPEDFRGEAFRNQVRQLEVGQISEPFLYGSEVMIVRLDERTAPTVQPFEQVRRDVMLNYARTMPSKLQEQELDALLKEANFRILF